MTKINRPLWFLVYLAPTLAFGTGVIYDWPMWLLIVLSVWSMVWAMFTDPAPRKPVWQDCLPVGETDVEWTKCDCPRCD